MCMGHWEDALALYTDCYIAGNMSMAEKNLRVATLEWRKDCAEYAIGLLRSQDDGMELRDFKRLLQTQYDDYTTQWLLKEYQKISLVQVSNTYIIQRRKQDA